MKLIKGGFEEEMCFLPVLSHVPPSPRCYWLMEYSTVLRLASRKRTTEPSANQSAVAAGVRVGLKQQFFFAAFSLEGSWMLLKNKSLLHLTNFVAA